MLSKIHSIPATTSQQFNAKAGEKGNIPAITYQ